MVLKITITIWLQFWNFFETTVVNVRCKLPIFMYSGANYMVLNELLVSTVLKLLLNAHSILVSEVTAKILSSPKYDSWSVVSVFNYTMLLHVNIFL